MYIMIDNDPANVCTLAEFRQANEEGMDADDLDVIAGLPIGGTARFGGGAAAEFLIRHISQTEAELCGEWTRLAQAHEAVDAVVEYDPEMGYALCDDSDMYGTGPTLGDALAESIGILREWEHFKA